MIMIIITTIIMVITQREWRSIVKLVLVLDRVEWKGCFPRKHIVITPIWVDVIGNLSGLKAVVFFMAIRTVALWYKSNLWDEITANHQPFFSLWGEMTTNDIVKIRKPQTCLKRMQVCPSDCTENTRRTECRGKWILFLHLQLILAFISSK